MFEHCNQFLAPNRRQDRCSHICTAEFIVNTLTPIHHRDVRKLLAEAFLTHAIKMVRGLVVYWNLQLKHLNVECG